MEFFLGYFVKNFKKKRFMNLFFEKKHLSLLQIKKLEKKTKKPKEKQNIGPMRSIIYLEGRHMHHMYASSLGLMVTLQAVVDFNMTC